MEEFLKEITIKAGDAVLEKFGKIGVKYVKTHANDVVTEADLISNKILTDAIKEKYPDHGIISEEEDDHQTNSEYIWVVDPLDGTLNFATKIPIFGVIVALARNNKVEMGAIYLPYFKEFYFAKRGEGAFLNEKKISCSNTKDWIGSHGVIGANWKKDNNYIRRNLIKSIDNEESVWVNSYGCVAISCAYTASGKRDWYASPGGMVWDYAAGSVILEEAGCIVKDKKGNSWNLDSKGLIAANKYLYPKLSEITQIKE